jgi:hypothetical protein
LFRWELKDLAADQLAGMPPHVQLALSDFMDAVVIVDPAGYQRRPGELDRPLRTLPFGQAGLVTFPEATIEDVVRMVYNTPTYTHGYKLAAAVILARLDPDVLRAMRLPSRAHRI